MDAGTAIALGSLCLVALTTILTYGSTRQKLAECERARLELRRNLQVVVSALLSTLPLNERVGLLQQLDAWVRPPEE